VRDAIVAEVEALPVPTAIPGIPGFVVDNSLGGKITSEDGGLTLGVRPNSVSGVSNLTVSIEAQTFQPGDPRASRNGVPLAYTYELTATEEITGAPVTQFDIDVVLVFNLDLDTLDAAGIHSIPHLYTYDEAQQIWVEVLSSWDPANSILVATTPHLSVWGVGASFDKVSNYLPSVSNFEMDLQSGSASVSYPIDLPAGPGGFGPKLSLSYNSGNVDRVAIDQQGSSPIGWGWSLSGSYVAAVQHNWRGCLTVTPSPTAPATPDPADQGYHPWTASIASDGASGELVEGEDGYWHTAIESFARVEYKSGTDTWEAWGPDGTHYYFTAKALDEDTWNKSAGLCLGNPVLRPYKWMLTSAVDVHGNTINYTYKYEVQGLSTPAPTPVTNARTRAVYPDTITWGAGGDKLKVEFNLVSRIIDDTIDKGEQDIDSGLYQSYRIDKINVKRLQNPGTPTGGIGSGSSPTYSLLYSYGFTQTYDIRLQTTLDPKDCNENDVATYPHLTLEGIYKIGNDSTTRLPATKFVYYNVDHACDPDLGSLWDIGHLYQAYNGYGGAVYYYYDKASGDIPVEYRRVRAKRIFDGLSPEEFTPHNVKYLYDYRGGVTNMPHISTDVSLPQPLSMGGQFRGFAWVREQIPLNQDASNPVYQTIDHYYSQDDTFKSKEWRTQVGKTYTYRDSFDTPTPNATVTTSPRWNVVGTVQAVLDPNNDENGVWKILATPNSSIQRTATATPTNTSTPTSTALPTDTPITAYLNDGADVTLRYYVGGNLDDPDTNFTSTFKLTSSTGNNYWGIKIYTATATGKPDIYAKVIWALNGVEGERDLSPAITNQLPREKRGLGLRTWQYLRLHTSPDGKFVVEMYDDDRVPNPDGGSGRYVDLYTDYIMLKSGDPLTTTTTVPNMPTGLNWTFSVSVKGDGSHHILVDDYAETRTVYSQQDSVFEVQNHEDNTATGFQWVLYPGQGNNTDGMHINFIPVITSTNTIYGAPPYELGTYKQTITAYEYESLYGDQIVLKEYNDPTSSIDNRTTYTSYISNTTTHVLGKPYMVRTYKTIMSSDDENSSNLLGKAVNYYDNHTSATTTPTNGDLTSVTQIGVADGTLYASDILTQSFLYDAKGNQTVVTDTRGYVTSTGYDPYYLSFPVEITHPNTTKQYIGYDFTLDALIGITDANGLVTRSTYDHMGRPATTWNEATGSSSSPNEIYKFTDLGLAEISAPFYISYTTMLSSTTGAASHAFGLRWYDGRGRVIQDVTPKDMSNTSLVDTFYNDTGQVVSSTLPYTGSYSYPPTHTTTPNQPNVSKEYDGIGRTTVITNPDGTSTLNEFWQLQWVREIDEAGNQHKWTHTDLLGRVDEVFLWDPTFPEESRVPPVAVDYAYDMLNRLLQTTRDVNNPNETVSSMYYDEFGRKSAMSDPDMGFWTYKYDEAGNITEQTDPLCIEILGCVDTTHHLYFEYDNMNRVTAKYYGTSHHSNGIADVKYYYDDALGDAATAKSWNMLRRAEVTLQGQGAEKANGHDYLYDIRGLLVSEAVTTSLSTRPYTTTYKYDEAGRPRSMTYPDPESVHEVVTTTYNAQGMGMPYSMTTNLDSVLPVWSAQYNIRGQMTQLVQGSAPFNNGVTTNFGYDDVTTKRGWLNNTTVVISGTEALNLTLGYSLDGNITSVAQSAGGTDSPTFNNTYTYDPFDRLKSAASVGTGGSSSLFATEVYTFDGLSRMITRTVGSNVYPVGYSSSPVDGPTSYMSMTYGYDTVGNQITRTNTLTSKGQTRTFDAENRLTRVVSATTNSLITEYIYGPNGERVIKTFQTIDNSGDVPVTAFNSRTLYVGAYEEELPPNKTVTWGSKTNVTALTPSNVLQKSGGTTWWDGGAISTESISSGDANGYVSVVADATNTHRMFGLGNTNASASYEDVEYGLHLMDDGTLEVLESGTNRGNKGAYTLGDVLKVAVVSGVVKYYRNSTVIYTSGVTPSYPLYMDTSIYTSGARLVGALLCAGNQCVSAPEYTSYYSFGGKLVGMRRVNAASGNGQFRMVGDHLGSTTLIVDTASPPSVVQRQYHKPYGETAWQYTASSTGGGSLTNVGYTAQRTDEDSSGLMFYNARLYDPTLSFFVSADTIAPPIQDPLGRNRYSYVGNNPIGYTDPTGQCKEDQGVDAGGCQAAKDKLRHLGFRVNLDEWSLQELDWIIEAMTDLLNRVMHYGGTYQDFRNIMGIEGSALVDLVNVYENKGAAYEDLRRKCAIGGGACTNGTGTQVGLNPSDLYNRWYGSGQNGSFKQYYKYMLVHELGHVMNDRREDEYANGLGEKVGSCDRYGCTREKSVSERGNDDLEDWAETVAAEVYPGYRPDSKHGSQQDAPKHRAYASSVFNGFFCQRNPYLCVAPTIPNPFTPPFGPPEWPR
jgi:RHS repeat-associated protein